MAFYSTSVIKYSISYVRTTTSSSTSVKQIDMMSKIYKVPSIKPMIENLIFCTKYTRSIEINGDMNRRMIKEWIDCSLTNQLLSFYVFDYLVVVSFHSL